MLLHHIILPLPEPPDGVEPGLGPGPGPGGGPGDEGGVLPVFPLVQSPLCCESPAADRKAHCDSLSVQLPHFHGPSDAHAEQHSLGSVQWKER